MDTLYGHTGEATSSFQFDPSSDDIVFNVVQALSKAVGTDATTSGPPLYEAIDPDALEQCIRSGTSDVRISFRLRSYRITVTGDGEIFVSEA